MDKRVRLPTWRLVAGGLITDRLLRAAAARLSLVSGSVEFTGDGNTAVLNLRCRNEDEGTKRFLIVKTSKGIVPVSGATCNGGSPLPGRFDGSDGIWGWVPARDSTGSFPEFRVTYSWNRAALEPLSRYLAIPSLAPVPVTPPIPGTELPRWTLGSGTSLATTGLCIGEGESSASFSCATVIVGPGTRIHEGGGVALNLSPALDRAVGRDTPRVINLVGNLTEFYRTIFGRDIHGSLMLVDESGSGFPGSIILPGCIVANAEDYGIRGGDPLDARLARQICSCWIGGGIRFTGRFAGEVEYALNTAFGMLWPLAMGKREIVELRMKAFQAAKSTLTSDWRYEAIGHRRPQTTYQLTQAFYSDLQHGSRLRDVLRNLVHTKWGRFVDTGELLRDFLPGHRWRDKETLVI
jgi:hypothetical protein